MSRLTITFADVLTKQLVQDWGDVHHLDAEETVIIHFEERFGAKTIRVESARDEGDVLMLNVMTDLWSVPREYGLSREGSLIW